MICQYCGKEVDANKKFCGYCGKLNPAFMTANAAQQQQVPPMQQPVNPAPAAQQVPPMQQPINPTPAAHMAPPVPPREGVPAAEKPAKKKLSKGAVTGIIIGVVALLLAIGAAAYFLFLSPEKTAARSLNKTCEQKIDQAEKAMSENDFGTAIALYREVIELDPDRTEKVAPRLEEAEKSFRVQSLNDAAIYAAQGDFETAVETLTDALKILPNDAELQDSLETYKTNYYLAQAEAYAANGDLESALDILDEALEEYPNNTELRNAYENYEWQMNEGLQFTDFRVAVITDCGDIYDESFNQAAYEGVRNFCGDYGIEYTYYKPTGDSTYERVDAITMAISDGYNVIVMPGYVFGEAILEVQDAYPDVFFIAIDVAPGDLTYDYVTYEEPSANSVCITFEEDQAGYLAGYAAVAEGYTELGFLGGMAVPAIVRYGYGFVQGANAAAEEFGYNVHIKFAYANQFFGDPDITNAMEGWYAQGTEVVFACGGGVFTSVCEAACEYGGYVIGMDVDQAPVINSVYGDICLTSAMKNLSESVEFALEKIGKNQWYDIGGKFLNLTISDGDYVCLPTDSWNFYNFSEEHYERVAQELANGGRYCSSDTDQKPNVSIDVTYIGSLK